MSVMRVRSRTPAMSKIKLKKLSCTSAPIMILQKGIAISLEGRHLVITLLASDIKILNKSTRKI